MERGHSRRVRRFALIIEGFQPRFSGQADRLLKWYWGAVSGMRDILRRDYGFPQENVTLLFQEREAGPGVADVSTRVNVERELSRLASVLTEEDELFCFFVDHGHFDGASSHFQLQDGTIADARMRELADRVKARRQVWVFTQCQSGGFAERMGAPGRIVMTSTMGSENNRESFAEPCRDGLAWPDGREGAPSIVQGYETALESVWRIFRERHRKGEPLQEHCLLNTGSRAEYGNYFKLARFMGAIGVPGQEFHVRFPVVSADGPVIAEGTNLLIRYELFNPTSREIGFESIFVACRGPEDENRDFGHVSNLVLPPKRSYLFEARFKLDKSGFWTLWPTFKKDGGCGPRMLETKVRTSSAIPVDDAHLRRLGDRRKMFETGAQAGSLHLMAFWPFREAGSPIAGDEVTFRLPGGRGLKSGYLQVCNDAREMRIDLRPHQIEGLGTVWEGVAALPRPGEWVLTCFADMGRGVEALRKRGSIVVG
jgi:hypothetical protein